jgi:hypothetical protein
MRLHHFLRSPAHIYGGELLRVSFIFQNIWNHSFIAEKYVFTIGRLQNMIELFTDLTYAILTCKGFAQKDLAAREKK